MKKLVIFGLIAVCGFTLYKFQYSKVVLHQSQEMAKAGKKSDTAQAPQSPAVVQVFVGPGCKKACANVEKFLENRKIKYDVIDASAPENLDYGVRDYPQTWVGKLTVFGYDRDYLVSALAEIYGDSVLTADERKAMKSHFDRNGNPVVVIYGASWCDSCRSQRQYFARHRIPFTELDVEASSSARFAFDTLHGQGFPLVYVGYRRFVGYQQKPILDAIAELRS